MTARCKHCNHVNFFSNYRGSKLKNNSCVACGSHDLERMATLILVFGDSPKKEDQLFDENFLPCFFADKNSKGEFFIYTDGKYSPIEVEKKNDYYYLKIKN